MSTKQLLMSEIEEVPEPFLGEVLTTAADGIRTHNIYLGKVALYH